eukprot:TRINITY_DN34692_c0_g1_i1.p1 TRINITY_DN34692_c0_g1~~TRINITY_DN34692_c0_g1_i1.p1  ORF type:complete len:148 (+),score=10.70 TRINITY_DN34692_c0_g1_i1:84-527(+)
MVVVNSDWLRTNKSEWVLGSQEVFEPDFRESQILHHIDNRPLPTDMLAKALLDTRAERATYPQGAAWPPEVWAAPVKLVEERLATIPEFAEIAKLEQEVNTNLLGWSKSDYYGTELLKAAQQYRLQANTYRQKLGIPAEPPVPDDAR